MSLSPTGAISLSQVAAELGRAGSRISLGDADVRTLAQVASGVIGMANLRGKSAYTPMTVTPHSVDDQWSTQNLSGTAYAGPSVSVVNGSGGYTYAWSFVSNPSGMALSNASSAQCQVSKFYQKNQQGSFSATLQCVVTDSTGRSVTVQATVYIELISNV